MRINTYILEREFLTFSDFITNKDGQPFKTFAGSKFIDDRENYKYSVYNEARINLGPKILEQGKYKMRLALPFKLE
jgi:hypothetical protein